MIQQDFLQGVLSNLSPGAAHDIMGWTHEVTQHLQRVVPGPPVWQRMLAHLVRMPRNSLPWAIHTTSRMVALDKNGKGDVRPIAIPTVTHKLLSGIALKALSPLAPADLMQTQYGSGMRDGCAQLGRSVMTHPATSP